VRRKRKKKEKGVSRVSELKAKINDEKYLNFVIHRMATDITEVLFR
jgi:hypothetical protein